MKRLLAPVSFSILLAAAAAPPSPEPGHPRLLFGPQDVAGIRARAADPRLKPVAARLLERAGLLLAAPPLRLSLTPRGEPDAAGEVKGLAAARDLQGRVLTLCMAFTLTGDQRYRDAAVRELDFALAHWPAWVDPAHPSPFDLMTGETCATFGLAYDWLYDDLTAAERQRLRQGAERRGLQPYLAATAPAASQAAQAAGSGAAKPPFWVTGVNNWNAVCHGGAALLALALEGESSLAARVLETAAADMTHFWGHLGQDGGWDEGTGYWTYGMRYGFMAAEALRRAGKPGGAEVFQLDGARRTGYFPLVFNPGRKLAAGFGDTNERASDPLFYLLGRTYRNPDFVWFQDRAGLRPAQSEGWPQEALTLLWRPVGEAWLPEKRPGFSPPLDPVAVFPSIGWGLMAPYQPDPPFFLALKSGSLAASHAHLDLGQVSIGFGDTLLAVELGSRPYPADYFGPQRTGYYEISTAGHNTILVAGRGQLPGHRGNLAGPRAGKRWVALTAIADGAYGPLATRVRRHAVLVDQRYFVLLDEVVTAAPQPVELRFHTYGKVRGNGAGGWIFAQDQAELDVVPAAGGEKMSGSLEVPPGWIKPVNVLRLQAPAAAGHLLVTVLQPRAASAPRLGAVRTRREGDQLTVIVGGDELTFAAADGNWRVEGLKVQ